MTKKFQRSCKAKFFLVSVYLLFSVDYSHLSNTTLTDFEKFHHTQKKSTLHIFWFLRFFPPTTPRLSELYISFFHKIPPSPFIPTSTFSDLANFALPPRLFQPPCLLDRWEYAIVLNLLCKETGGSIKKNTDLKRVGFFNIVELTNHVSECNFSQNIESHLTLLT